MKKETTDTTLEDKIAADKAVVKAEAAKRLAADKAEADRREDEVVNWKGHTFDKDEWKKGDTTPDGTPTEEYWTTKEEWDAEHQVLVENLETAKLALIEHRNPVYTDVVVDKKWAGSTEADRKNWSEADRKKWDAQTEAEKKRWAAGTPTDADRKKFEDDRKRFTTEADRKNWTEAEKKRYEAKVEADKKAGKWDGR